MSNYFDNQKNWSWINSDGKVTVVTNHGDHTHTLDVTSVPIGEMVENGGKVMGDAHRASSHDPIVENDEVSNTVDITPQCDLKEGVTTGTDMENGGIAEDGDGIEGLEGVDADDGIDM